MVDYLRNHKHPHRDRTASPSPHIPVPPPSLIDANGLRPLLLRFPHNVRYTSPNSQDLKLEVKQLTTFLRRVIIAATCKLVYLAQDFRTPDPISDTWPIAICTQTIQCLSILSACFPCLRSHCSEEGRSIESGITRRKITSQLSHVMDFDGGRASTGLRDMTGGRHAAGAVAGVGGQDARLRDQGSMSQVYMIQETKTFAVEQEALACRYC